MSSLTSLSTYSVWVNPTADYLKVKLFRGPGVKELGKHNSAFEVVEWKPGEEKILPAEFDVAIHKIDANGVIVGGKGPQLRKKGEPYNLHPSLDTALAEKQAALVAASALMDQQRDIQSLSVIAKAKMDALEEKKEAHRIVEAKVVEQKSEKNEKLEKIEKIEKSVK